VTRSHGRTLNGHAGTEAGFTELRHLLAAQAARIDAIASMLGRLTATSFEPARATDEDRAAAAPPKSPGQRVGPTSSRPAGGKAGYAGLVRRLRRLLRTKLRRGATVAVVSKGDEALVRLDGLNGCHYPQTRAGVYAGYNPGTSAEALLYLEGVRRKGADYLVFPKTAVWWLDYYAEFSEYLSRHHEKIIDDPELCVVYRLGDVTGASLTPARQQVRVPAPSKALTLFDANWYVNQNPVGLTPGTAPVEHYLSTGAEAGRDPHPLFDGNWYLEQNPDVATAGMNPLEHYLARGAQQGRSPHPLFDAKFYWRSYPDTVLAGQSPLEHYLTVGWKKGYRPNPTFDPGFYLSAYPDVEAAGIEPLTHFVSAGLREGRVGNPDDVTYPPYRAAFKISRAPGAYRDPADESVRAIAFHLPQFHPIRENDKWWGKGFTEWTNVRRATRQFRGHYQPHVPSELGYYDLREPAALERQAELARAHGVHGFCFYYYWFAGKVLLDRPLRRMLASGKPDFPFCICWANENWTRRWDGMDHEVLIAQRHSPEDDLAFLRAVEPILLQRNYLRVGDRPLLVVYRPGLLPDARATADRWRAHFRRRGHGEIYLAMARTFRDRTPAAEFGFDAVIQFPPHLTAHPVNVPIPGRRRSFHGRIHDYEWTKRAFLEDLRCSPPDETLYPGVMPSWDNTARRRGAATVWVNSSPESYYDWLSKAADHLRRNRPADERLVFINAWNEWGEGCHLEPDRKYGHAWLNATKLALRPERRHEEPPAPEAPEGLTPGSAAPIDVAFVSHDAHPHGAQYCLLTLAAWLKEAGLVAPRFLLLGGGPLSEDFSRIGPVLRLDGAAAATTRTGAQVRRAVRAFCGPNLSAVYVNSAAAGRACRWTRQLNVPHVVHVHELEKSIRRWVGKDTMALLRESADLVVAASDPVADNLRTRHRMAADKIRTIEECVRCTNVRRPGDAAKRRCQAWLGLDPGAKTVLGCGTTDWRKGPDLFVEVAARVRRRYQRPVQFVWVGSHTRPAEARDLNRLVTARGLAGTVKFVGPVATPLPYMMAADLFLLPSREDPFPLVCLEAADCGLPVVCFAKAGGMPDFVAPDGGTVVPYLNIPRMAGAVLSLLEDDAAARRAGDRARDKVRTEFDVSVKGREIYDMLAALCSSRS
jgi:glycosyltransferase involved in cell wall biosynthesis